MFTTKIGSFSVKRFGTDSQPILGFPTTCCSLMIMSVQDFHTLDDLRYAVNVIKADSNKKHWYSTDRSGGERNIMVIVSPGESELEKNLRLLGFKLLTSNMPRRKGYPKGMLKMYLYSF
jgi:hypothetical protein